MMYVHTFFIALAVFLMGLLCVVATDDMVHTSLGRQLSLGFSVFWFIRLLIQFFCYSSSLWRGKTFETIVHVLFSVFWGYLTWAFFVVYWTGG